MLQALAGRNVVAHAVLVPTHTCQDFDDLGLGVGGQAVPDMEAERTPARALRAEVGRCEQDGTQDRTEDEAVHETGGPYDGES
jgi:hypothetical protein